MSVEGVRDNHDFQIRDRRCDNDGANCGSRPTINVHGNTIETPRYKITASDPDHGKAFRHPLVEEEVVERRDQLAPGQVPGAAKDHKLSRAGTWWGVGTYARRHRPSHASSRIMSRITSMAPP